PSESVPQTARLQFLRIADHRLNLSAVRSEFVGERRPCQAFRPQGFECVPKALHYKSASESELPERVVVDGCALWPKRKNLDSCLHIPWRVDLALVNALASPATVENGPVRILPEIHLEILQIKS